MKQSLINAMRKGTAVALKIDSHPIVLTPHERVRKPGGVFDWEPRPPKPVQQLGIDSSEATLSGITGTGGGVSMTDGATVHKWNYEIYGPYNASIDIGDTWESDGVIYRVISIKPSNGYERRGVVSAIGKDPDYGA